MLLPGESCRNWWLSWQTNFLPRSILDFDLFPQYLILWWWKNIFSNSSFFIIIIHICTKYQTLIVQWAVQDLLPLYWTVSECMYWFRIKFIPRTVIEWKIITLVHSALYVVLVWVWTLNVYILECNKKSEFPHLYYWKSSMLIGVLYS